MTRQQANLVRKISVFRRTVPVCSLPAKRRVERHPPELDVQPWLGLPCPACEVGFLEIRCVVNRRGQVVYANPHPTRMTAIDWDRLGVDGWDTS